MAFAASPDTGHGVPQPGVPIRLTGTSLTTGEVVAIADGAPVAVAPEGWARLATGHSVLLRAARAGQPLYGLTLGVGLNKDRVVLEARGDMTPEMLRASVTFNLNLLRSHAGGLGPPAPERTVRAAMALRLNTFLLGTSGVRPVVAEMLEHFLNRHITPLIPARGSVGVGDVTLLSHIGLALVGDGEVFHRGQRVPAAQALAAEGLQPLEPLAKDALAILSSNAYAAGMAALTLARALHVQDLARLVFALSLEALNGNLTPMLPEVAAQRPVPMFQETAAVILQHLAGSALWRPDPERQLQDPLSYRNGAHILALLATHVRRLQTALAIQLNTTDDNPGIALPGTPAASPDTLQAQYAVPEGGAVYPSGHFSPLFWVTEVEALALALAHLSNGCAQRVVKLVDPFFTNLPRYLGEDAARQGLIVMEIPLMAMCAENRALAAPVSQDYPAVARGVEDVGTNSVLALERVDRQLDNTYTILGIEMIHVAQAVDLRLRRDPTRPLGAATGQLLRAFRTRVPYLEEDQPLSDDLQFATEFLQAYRP